MLIDVGSKVAILYVGDKSTRETLGYEIKTISDMAVQVPFLREMMSK